MRKRKEIKRPEKPLLGDHCKCYKQILTDTKKEENRRENRGRGGCESKRKAVERHKSFKEPLHLSMMRIKRLPQKKKGKKKKKKN